MANTYEDPRLEVVETERQEALQEIQDTYGNMTGNVQENLQKQQTAAQNWADQQTKLQQEQTDFTVKQIEQQKEQTQKDLEKEQSAAYTDYKKQTAKHGVNAEQMADQGMTGSGFSESSRVAQYTAYQNRVAVARASAEQAMVSFNNAITQAQLQNSSAMAQIAYEGLQTQLQLGLQAMQYENQVLSDMLSMKINAQSMYHGQYMDVLSQINQEKAFQESVRQYDQNYAYQLGRDQIADEQWRESLNYQKDQDELAQENWKKTFEYQQEQDRQAQTNWEKEFEETQRQYNTANGLDDDTTGNITQDQEISYLGNENTKAAEASFLTEKEFSKYKGSGRVKVNGKSPQSYQEYVLAKIEEIANKGLNGKQLTDAEIEWLIAKYADL